MIVPRLPGSRTSSQIAMSVGDDAKTSRIEVGDWRATATMPCGVTVSAIASSTASVVNSTSRPAAAGGFSDVGVPLHRRRRREQLDERVGPVAERLARGLRALEQEEARLFSRAALDQFRDGADTRRPRILKHGFSIEAQHPVPLQAGDEKGRLPFRESALSSRMPRITPWGR